MVRQSSTALSHYARLECSGLWREHNDAQRREVIVFFREASLILADPRSDQPLAHWSLPAVERLNDTTPALYAPGADHDGETLEIDEPAMIEALSTVHGAILAARPHPGRVRNIILAVSLGLVILAGLFLPGAIRSHTVAVVPDATRVRLGDMAMTEMLHLTGAPCAAPLGRAATETLATRVFNAASVRIYVMNGLPRPVHLPGRQILLPSPLVEQQDSPDVAAGAALAEGIRSTEVDPLQPLLRYAGTWATLRLLTTGQMPQDALDGYAEWLVQSTPEGIPGDRLLARFGAADLSVAPYARALRPDQAEALVAEDPWPEGPPRPILTDNEWLSLQSVCQG
ncbi:hypothetical protein [Falsirhodobacter halotolerans]|uniref:hypothetical protein n=1 Tax=Falsirhodobacter halotolerans TaxID=1146892 RepID=UPI001FD154B9|nr:hypothetical protein [Falsirhodobacter halotolerans]MCJ8138903.1 hypothetical protein [Falsirhodobacter halotolerans]